MLVIIYDGFQKIIKNHLNIPVVFKCRATEIVHFIIKYDAGFHAFFMRSCMRKFKIIGLSKYSVNQNFRWKHPILLFLSQTRDSLSRSQRLSDFNMLNIQDMGENVFSMIYSQIPGTSLNLECWNIAILIYCRDM